MVSKEIPVYLLIGQGSVFKDTQIKRIAAELLRKEAQEFNLDVLYGKGLKLDQLQERLLCLPAGDRRRVLIIRDTQDLKDELKAFLLSQVKKRRQANALVLDIDKDDPEDSFLAALKKYARVLHFRQEYTPGTFDLVRQIELKRVGMSLKILHRLLLEGFRPEFILGALRSVGRFSHSGQAKKIMKLLLSCDLEIKTGRLAAPFALEKLVVSLCALGNFGKLAH
jgi:DNA polymerase III delta subunit